VRRRESLKVANSISWNVAWTFSHHPPRILPRRDVSHCHRTFCYRNFFTIISASKSAPWTRRARGITP
jgi:hypothetical protein